jgi:hypothetical protein
MKRDKKSNYTNSTFKTKWLRVELVWGLIMLLGIINYGCDKEDSDVYYVKYKVDSSTVNSGGKLNVTINSENNEKLTLIINQNTKWETIIGPVSKGFNAKLSASNRTGTDNLHIYTEIDVSENDSPFAIKANDGSYDSVIFNVSMASEYTIDY